MGHSGHNVYTPLNELRATLKSGRINLNGVGFQPVKVVKVGSLYFIHAYNATGLRSLMF